MHPPASQHQRRRSAVIDDSLEPVNREHNVTTTSVSVAQDGSQSIGGKPHFTNYRDAILNKFEKRTTHRLIEEMRRRDAEAPLMTPAERQALANLKTAEDKSTFSQEDLTSPANEALTDEKMA